MRQCRGRLLMKTGLRSSARIFEMCVFFDVMLLLFVGSCISPVSVTTVTPRIPQVADVIRHTVNSKQTHISSAGQQLSSGIGIGFIWPEEDKLPPSERSQTEEIRLEKGSSFTPHLILQAGQPTTFLVSVLLDYHQVEFELDGQRGLLHEVGVEPVGDLEMPIKIDIVGNGAHDLVIIGFADPYNPSVDVNYRSSMDQRLVGRRAVIIVGEDERPTRQMPASIRGTQVPEDIQLNLGVGFATAPGRSNAHPSERQMYVTQGSPEQQFDYQIWTSNLGATRTVEYALVSFLDFHQIPVKQQQVLSLLLNPNEEAVVDNAINFPQTIGTHQMQIVYVVDPYRSIHRKEVATSFVMASPRIALIVK